MGSGERRALTPSGGYLSGASSPVHAVNNLCIVGFVTPPTFALACCLIGTDQLI